MTLIRTDNVKLDGPTRAVGHGYDVDTGDEVTYAGDPRALADIALAVMDGELPEAYIESWQELSRVQLGAVAHSIHHPGKP